MFFLKFPGSPDNRFSSPVTYFIDREAGFPPLIQARQIKRRGKYCAGLEKCIPTRPKPVCGAGYTEARGEAKCLLA